MFYFIWIIIIYRELIMIINKLALILRNWLKLEGNTQIEVENCKILILDL
jgi:hypothetical protein